MLKNTHDSNRIYKYIFKVILISVGLAFIGLGVALMHKSSLGTSAIDTLCNGISRQLGVSLGTSSFIVYIILFIPCIIFARDTIRTGTLLATFTQGFYINFFYNLIPDIAGYEITWLKYLFSLIGVLLCSFGISFYVSVKEGLGPLEGVTEVFISKLKWSYKRSKTATDLILLFFGLILGGVYGPGTLINVLCIGRLIQFFLKRMNIYFRRVLT